MSKSITRHCCCCQRRYEVSREGDQVFCSSSCAETFRGGMPRSKPSTKTTSNDDEDRCMRTCQTCGDRFSLPMGFYKHELSMYCTPACVPERKRDLLVDRRASSPVSVQSRAPSTVRRDESSAHRSTSPRRHRKKVHLKSRRHKSPRKSSRRHHSRKRERTPRSLPKRQSLLSLIHI